MHPVSGCVRFLFLLCFFCEGLAYLRFAARFTRIGRRQPKADGAGGRRL